MAPEIPLIGDLLKEKREEKKISLEKVALKTKISPKLLRLIEANNFEALPGPAYLKGFVLSYARIIGLDKIEATNSLEISYQRILGKPFPNLNHTLNFKLPSDSPETKEQIEFSSPANVLSATLARAQQTKAFIAGGIFIAVFLGAFGIYKIITNAINSESNIAEESKFGPTFVPSSDILKAPPVPAQNQIEPDAKSAQDKKTETETPQSAATPVPIHRIYPHVEFKKVTAKLFEVLVESPDNSDDTILPPEIKSRVSSDLENIYIRAHSGNTWLSYKIDKQPINSRIIEKDKDLFLQGKEIAIFLGNVGVTKIFYNNKLITTPTTTGVKSLIFPESAGKNYLLPLFPKASDDILYTAEEYMKRMKMEEEQVEKAKSEKP